MKATNYENNMPYSPSASSTICFLLLEELTIILLHFRVIRDFLTRFTASIFYTTESKLALREHISYRKTNLGRLMESVVFHGLAGVCFWACACQVLRCRRSPTSCRRVLLPRPKTLLASSTVN